VPRAEIRRATAAVLQQPLRYPGTWRENLAPGGSVRAEAARRALATVGLDAYAADLDAWLGPEFGGRDLSGGEWQRLAIARALLREDAEVVVFDEPTAALDPLAELELFRQFAELARGKTTVLISHRLGPTRLADLVLVLEGGRLVEAGPPARLLAAGGLFAQMFAAQAEWYR
jgi:ATP-binding cassette subfamily B protein